MNVKDLRIDSFYFLDGEVFKMDSNKLSYVLSIGGEYELTGIPLTEERLLRYGLKIHDLESGSWNSSQCVGKYLKEDQLYFVVDANDDGYGGLNYTTTEIQHEHELQNLYYFWHKEELKISE